MTPMQIEYRPVASLIAYARNPRKNDHAVEQMAGAKEAQRASDGAAFGVLAGALNTDDVQTASS